MWGQEPGYTNTAIEFYPDNMVHSNIRHWTNPLTENTKLT